MNPWIIVSWIGAICTCVVIIAMTAAVAVALLKPSKAGSKNILRSK